MPAGGPRQIRFPTRLRAVKRGRPCQSRNEGEPRGETRNSNGPVTSRLGQSRYRSACRDRRSQAGRAACIKGGSGLVAPQFEEDEAHLDVEQSGRHLGNWSDTPCLMSRGNWRRPQNPRRSSLGLPDVDLRRDHRWSTDGYAVGQIQSSRISKLPGGRWRRPSDQRVPVLGHQAAEGESCSIPVPGTCARWSPRARLSDWEVERGNSARTTRSWTVIRPATEGGMIKS